MITKIEAVNFRCLRNVSQTVGPFQVLTGPNASGKSTFLSVPALLGLFAQEGLEAVWEFTHARALEELLFLGSGSSFQLAVECALPETLRGKAGHGPGRPGFSHLRYEVEIGRENNTPHPVPPRILAENLWLMPDAPQQQEGSEAEQLEFPAATAADRSLIHIRARQDWRKVASKTLAQNATFRSETSNWNFQLRNPAGKSALSTLPEDERFSRANWFKALLVDRLQQIMLRSEKMLEPSSPLKPGRFAPDGSNLPQVIRALRTDPAAYASWIDHVRTVLPTLKDFEVHELPEDRRLFFDALFADGHRAHSWQLSDGTLRLLALTLLAYAPGEPAVYLVEEPENGIHPQAIQAVYEALSNLDEGQVLVATHSPVFVAQVRPDQMLCFAKGPDDSANVIRGDRHPRLRDWRGQLDLAQLYAAGVLS